MTHEKVAREVQAQVVAVWMGTEKVLLSVPDEGLSLEAWAPADLAEHLSAGVEVTLYLDDDDQPVGWYLPSIKRGVRTDAPVEGPSDREHTPCS